MWVALMGRAICSKSFRPPVAAQTPESKARRPELRIERGPDRGSSQAPPMPGWVGWSGERPKIDDPPTYPPKTYKNLETRLNACETIGRRMEALLLLSRPREVACECKGSGVGGEEARTQHTPARVYCGPAASERRLWAG
jgi:hypothetical protein